MKFLDEAPFVARYAYFMDGPGVLVNDDGSFTDLGNIYNS
jgi:hypothetical protein